MDGSINFSGTLAGSIADGGGGNVDDVKVRHSQTTEYESVVNDEKIALIDLVSYVRRNELTQAIENIENSIDNVEQLVDTKQNIINYSTEEQNTGTKWIDGKGIYCRVLDLGSDTTFSPGWTALPITHNNVVDTMIKASGINSGGYSQSIGLAANDPTYFEVDCYKPIIIRYIICYYTKKIKR